MFRELASHYDAIAFKREEYRRKHWYYYGLLHRRYQYFVSPGKKVLVVGCSTGDLLNELKPSVGVGVDVSQKTVEIAQKKFPAYSFICGKVKDIPPQKFDVIILTGVLGEVDDIQELLESLLPFCTQDTRLVIEYYSYFWQSILKLAERLALKVPQMVQNWVTENDIRNFLVLAGYEYVKSEKAILLPVWIPGLSFLVNKFLANLPFFNALTLNHFVIARPALQRREALSTTILVPCRNEKGNIESAIMRTPRFGGHQEFIFVEGHSRDGTWEEVLRVKEKYKDLDIKAYKQEGKGKGDAVRLGFSKATSDILMILDADLTVAPEDLPKFYEAIASNKGEFINGCRLVYPMEKEAMRFLNLCANKFFGLFFSWLLGQRFKDTLCGTKVLARRHYEAIVASRAYFGDFDPFGDFDLIFGAVKLNLKVVELPIRYKERVYGTTQIQRFYHGLLLLRMCFFAMKKIKFKA